MLTYVVGIYMAIFATKTWPRQTFWPLVLGATTTAVGISVMAWAVHVRNDSVIFGMMALVGHGVMLRMNPGAVHCLAYFPNLTARITCLSAFAIPFGGLFGLTLMTTVFNNKIGNGTTTPQDSIMWAFVAVIPFMWVCVMFASFIGNVWILDNGEHQILRGSYLWQLVTRKTMVRETSHRGDGRLEMTMEGGQVKQGEV